MGIVALVGMHIFNFTKRCQNCFSRWFCTCKFLLLYILAISWQLTLFLLVTWGVWCITFYYWGQKKKTTTKLFTFFKIKHYRFKVRKTWVWMLAWGPWSAVTLRSGFPSPSHSCVIPTHRAAKRRKLYWGRRDQQGSLCGGSENYFLSVPLANFKWGTQMKWNKQWQESQGEQSGGRGRPSQVSPGQDSVFLEAGTGCAAATQGCAGLL